MNEAIELELFRHRFEAVAAEMGEVLTRAAFSPNIKERRDHSCAVFDATGDMIAQAAHIPVHLGAAPLCVKAVVARLTLADGETAIVNDPYAGGTHLPDITLVTAVDLPAGARWYVASRAHHADVGGIAPGSLPPSRTIDDEGWRVPPMRLDDAVERSLLEASRTPVERRGDLRAQRAANELGRRRVLELAARFGSEALSTMAAALMDYAERGTRAALRELPRGEVRVEDVLDDAFGDGAEVSIRLHVRHDDDGLLLDLSDSDGQVEGPMNAVRAIVDSAVFYVLRCLAGEGVPANSGVMRVPRVVTRPGTVVDAEPPAAVAAGNVETSQRMVDVLMQGFGALAPGRLPACSQGTMNNVLIGSVLGAGAPWVYYETLAGGYGGGPHRAGASATHSHMTNTLNTPIEALEHAFPMRIVRYEVRRGSGGEGAHAGGDGLVRAYELLAPAEVTVIAERRGRGAPGADGGEAGAPGAQRASAGGVTTALPGKVSRVFDAGTVLEIETPGGGGWGRR